MADRSAREPGAAPQIRVFPDATRVTEAARMLVGEQVRAIVARDGAATIALAGGSTPLALYTALAHDATVESRALPWHAITLVYGDERCVPWTDARSNHGAVTRALLEPLAAAGIAPAAVLPMRTDLAPDVSAARYEAELRAARPIDLVLLGMGADGHTASLFPGSATLAERARLAIAVDAPAPPNVPVPRISITMPAIQSAPFVVMLATGAEKSAALQRARRERPTDAEALPIARAQGTRATWWLVDVATGLTEG